MADNKKPSSGTTENSTSNPNGAVWMIGGLILILSLFAIGVAFFTDRSEEADQTAEIQVTASISNSIVMPTAVPEGASNEELALTTLSSTDDESLASEVDDSAGPPVIGEGEGAQPAEEQEGAQNGEQGDGQDDGQGDGQDSEQGDAQENGQSNEQSENVPSDSASPSSLMLGQTLIGQSANGSRIRLYLNAASDAPVMHVYENGASFVLLESDIDDLVYPIQIDEQEWYRVRAADGLVGWISGGTISLSNGSPEPVPTIAG